MARASSRGLALGGFMGTGKSTVGRRLAERLDLPFVDMDDVLAERFGPIPEQFERAGEAVFRAREASLVESLCDGVTRVVATGGGAWVDPANRSRLAGHYHLVVLRAAVDQLRMRVGEGAGRPLWGEAEALLASRQVAYRHADLVVDTDELDVDEVTGCIIRWMERT